MIGRIRNILARLYRAEDVLLVHQSPEQWDEQFRKGRWSRLTHRQPNTALIAGMVLDEAAQGSRVLDVGCGNGALARLVDNSAAKVEYKGIDFSERAIEQAKASSPQMIFLVMEAENPSFASEKFDLIVFNEVLYYVDPSKALPAYRPYAVEGAVVIVSMVCSWRSRTLWRRIEKELETITTLRVVSPQTGRSWEVRRMRFR